MTFAAYLIVAAGSVNHLALFRETAIRLPVLNADLPLVAFFAIAPFFLILFHFYLFLNLVTLSRRIATYNQVLVAAVAAEDDRNLLRTRLDTFLVVQLLSRPSRSRTGINAWLLNVVVWITLVGVPILILLQFQLTFLPYHLSSVTWIHRFFIVADLALIWFFWFAIYRRGELHFPRLKSHLVGLGCSIAVVLVSLVVVAYPGEPLGQLVRVKLPMVCSEKRVPISDCFLRGPVNMVTGQPQRYFFNVLVLPFQTLTDVKKAEAGQETSSLRGRDLTGAILIRSDIRGMDFTGTNLDNARLDFAVASGVKFGCDDIGAPPPENPDWPDHGCSSLRGASLYGANLSGAKFFGARMEGSVLIHANLSGANLKNVHLEATVLAYANFTAAYIGLTRLQSAYLFNTNLSGATLKDSQLDGALLQDSRFEFASLGHLGSVGVGNTVGQPVLDFAAFDLDGSSVPPPAYVSDFKDMRDRMLNVLFNEEKRRAPWFGTALSSDSQSDGFLIFTPTYYESFYNDENKKTDWGKVKSNVHDLWNSVKKTPADTPEEDLESFKRRFLTERFAEMACDTENAPFVARGLIWNEIIVRSDLLADSFLTKVRDTQNCRGAAGLKPEDYGAFANKRAEVILGRPVMDKTDIRLLAK
ncbi:MAG TPA: pentapeptide repeat-containing protein [Pseudolabrys sp.]|nr:pentapeptide repeat-containing protein [Pseudolabrys sp.]